MDKNIKYMNKEIMSGKGLEENIPQLFNHLVNHYHSFSAVRLAMHYYAFYETYCDDEDTWGDEAKNTISNLNRVIGEAVLKSLSGKKLEDEVRKVDGIRNEITKRMKVLTIYTDIFRIYEYVLNRTEYRFKEEITLVEDDELAKEVLRYIFDTEDNVIINDKIREMVGQLPIRMTKQKYFDLLKDSIGNYKGSEKSSLDSYLYMLRTSAMLYSEEDMQAYYPKLWENKEFLAHLKYKDITENEFEKAVEAIRVASLMLETQTNVYYSLQEIVNGVYAILLCSPYVGMVTSGLDKQEEAAFAILSGVHQVFVKNGKKELPSRLLELFTEIEGVQEELSYDLPVMEDSLYEIDRNHRKLTESLMIDKMLNILLHSGKLLSNSLFIDIDEKASDEVADEETLEKETVKLLEELSTLFEEHDRMVDRAVMANTLNKIPVFFQNHTEVMDYVRYSIEHCTEKYEKMACTEIIRGIMNE